jgi:hypothetical protein
MPVHDWTRVEAGIFHDFHHGWIGEIKRALNRGLESTGLYAMVGPVAETEEPDAVELLGPIQDASKWYATTKKAVTIRHISEHRVVAVLEILSPGNKSGRAALADLEYKVRSLLAGGIHVGLVDLFPPTSRDPEGIHPLIWDEDDEGIFRFDPRQPLTCASYIGGIGAEAFVEPVAVGDKLPNLPLFLCHTEYVPVPLEETYQAAFAAVPEFWRDELLTKGRKG